MFSELVTMYVNNNFYLLIMIVDIEEMKGKY